MSRLSVFVVLCSLIVLVGCGSSSDDAPLPETPAGTAPAPDAQGKLPGRNKTPIGGMSVAPPPGAGAFSTK